MFDMGYLTIGLSDIALQYPKIVASVFDKSEIRSFIEYSYRERFNPKLLVEYNGNIKERILPASWSFFNFLYDFKVGDRVIVIPYPNKGHFIICKVLERADVIKNLPINQLIDANGINVKLEDGLLRRNYKEFIDLGFFVKVKKLTRPIDGVLKGTSAINGSLNRIANQIEEFIKKYSV